MVVVGGAIYSKLFLWGNEINSVIFVRRKKREHCIFIVHKRSLQRLCFYTCQSFCSQVGCLGPGLGCVSAQVGCLGPGLGGSLPRGWCSGPGDAQAHGVCIPACTEADTTPPPRRRPLQRTVRILLECILVC